MPTGSGETRISASMCLNGCSKSTMVLFLGLGLKGIVGQVIQLPRRREDRPDRKALGIALRGAPVAADAASRLWRELRSGVSKCPSEGSKIDFVHGMRETAFLGWLLKARSWVMCLVAALPVGTPG
jgi:hypothetical protein